MISVGEMRLYDPVPSLFCFFFFGFPEALVPIIVFPISTAEEPLIFGSHAGAFLEDHQEVHKFRLDVFQGFFLMDIALRWAWS
jgi:hypothetical protein